MGERSWITGTLWAASILHPVPLLGSPPPQAPPFPGTHLLLCFLFWSCLNCMIFIDDCELFSPERGARNTNSPAHWYSPWGAGEESDQPSWLCYLHGALNSERNLRLSHIIPEAFQKEKESPRKGCHQEVLHLLGMLDWGQKHLLVAAYIFTVNLIWAVCDFWVLQPGQ